MPYFSETTENADKSSPRGLHIRLIWKGLTLTPELAEFTREFLEKSNPDATDATMFRMFLISEVDHPMGLWMMVNGIVRKNKLEVLQLSLNRKPKSEVPEDFLNLSKKLGGFPEGATRIFKLLEGAGGMCTVEATLLFPKSPFKFEKRDFGTTLSPVKLEWEAYSFSIGDSTAEVKFFEDEGAILESKQKFDLDLNANCFEDAAETLIRNLSALWATL